MTILSAQSIRDRVQDTERLIQMGKQLKWGFNQKPDPKHALVIRPFEPVAKQTLGMSYGLGSCGYDIRLGKIGLEGSYTAAERQGYNLKPGEFILCSALEYMEIPHDLCPHIVDKSTLARQGLAVQNTVGEPGWRGYLTLELSNHSSRSISLRVGQPIAQIQFHTLDQPTDTPYVGKYQDQPDRPVEAILQQPVDEPSEMG